MTGMHHDVTGIRHVLHMDALFQDQATETCAGMNAGRLHMCDVEHAAPLRSKTVALSRSGPGAVVLLLCCLAAIVSQ